jgi:hypothetical protein
MISAVPQPPTMARISLALSRDGHNNSCPNDESLNGFGRLGIV